MTDLTKIERDKHGQDLSNSKYVLPEKENGKILQLEFDLKHAKEHIFKLEKKLEENDEITKKIKKQLLETIERNRNKNDDVSIRVFAEINYIYNLFKEMEG